MNLERLQERLQNIDARFNTAKVARDQSEAVFQESETEIYRIQGEYRAVKDLIDNWDHELDVVDIEKPQRKVKLHPVDETGIPAEGTIING